MTQDTSTSADTKTDPIFHVQSKVLKQYLEIHECRKSL